MLPSAFIDNVKPSGDRYLYIVYSFSGSPTSRSDGRVHIARAKLGGRNADGSPAKLEFKKWYKGGWNTPGIQTGMASMNDDGIEPGGCGGPSYNANPQLMYNEALGLYMLTYVCRRLIEGSMYPTTSKAGQDGTVHFFEDGGYPTFMTPGCGPGSIGLTGYSFLLKGDPLGPGVYARRKFAINSGNTPVRKACGSDIPQK